MNEIGKTITYHAQWHGIYADDNRHNESKSNRRRAITMDRLTDKRFVGEGFYQLL